MKQATLTPKPAHAPPRAAKAADTMGWREGLKLTWQMLFAKPAGTRPDQAVPVQALSAHDITEAPDGSLWRLGHSTVLIKLQGGLWLTDPVFCKRASPFQWLGPARFHAPPIALHELPPLTGVILSHDHYDHLDKAAIKQLAHRAHYFVTPTGVGDLIVKWGVPAHKVSQLAWWEATTLDGVTLTAAPAQHFSGRGLRDRNQRLWCSWAVRSPEANLYFSGDTGYFSGFQEIGQRLGPFDLTLIEDGAYDRRWQGVHMLPEQTAQAHLDLRGKHLVPIHNGTFDLAFHRWDDPMERISLAARQRGISLLTPRFGERVNALTPHPYTPWWRDTPAAP